jgi:hypothetical protein
MILIKLAELLSKIEPISSRIEIRELLKTFLKSLDKEDVDKVVYLLQSEIFRNYDGIELNLGNNLLEETIAKAYGYTRLEVEKHHLKSGI